MANSTVRPWMAPALFPAMMINPFVAMFVYMSKAMLRFADVVNRRNASHSLERKENPSVLPDIAPAKSAEPSKLRLVKSAASKDAGRTAQPRKANSHTRRNHKAKV